MMIGIGNDHTGYELKMEIIKYFEENKIEYKDLDAVNKNPVITLFMLKLLEEHSKRRNVTWGF